MKSYKQFLKTLDKLFELLLSPRFKSFYWRTAMMALAGFLTILTNSITELGLSKEVAVVIGLILGELSKHLNNKYGDIKVSR
jgi:fructose-specific phosphotransferase system IIC component